MIHMALKFTIVMDEDLARKMSYIGKCYGRSRIKETGWVCRRWVKEFEKTVDKIEPEDA